MRGNFKKLIIFTLMALLITLFAVGCGDGGKGQTDGDGSQGYGRTTFVALLSESEFKDNAEKFKNADFRYTDDYVSYIDGVFKKETQLSIGSTYYCVVARLFGATEKINFYLDFKAEKSTDEIPADEVIDYSSYEIIASDGDWNLTGDAGRYELAGGSDGSCSICVAVKFTAESAADISFGGGMNLYSNYAEYFAKGRILNAKLADISGLTLKFGTEEDCPLGEINDGKLTDSVDFKDGEKYYAVVDFDVTPEENCGGERLTATFVISPSKMLSPTLFEAASGSFSEFVKGGKTYVNLTYALPESGSRHIRIVLRLIPRLYGRASLYFGFDGDGVSAVGEYSKTLETQTYGKYSFETPLKYELNIKGDGYVVTGVDDWTTVMQTGLLVVPAFHDGLPVTEIGWGAFEQRSSIKSAYLPPTVTKIRTRAFARVPLIKLELSNSVTVIEADAFKECKSSSEGGKLEVYFSGSFEEWSAINFANDYSNPLCNVGYNQYENKVVYCKLYCDGEFVENSYGG